MVGIKVKLFADYVKMYVKLLDNHELEKLQAALDSLVKWAEPWQLTISIEKCCVLNIGSTQNYAYLHISNDVLPVVDQARDPGVIVSHDLRPATHINAMIAKAHHAIANAIHREFVSRDTSYNCPIISCVCQVDCGI